MVPNCLVDDEFKSARDKMRDCMASLGAGFVGISVAMQSDNGKALICMAASPALEGDPTREVALVQCALARLLALAVLHLGEEGATMLALGQVAHAAELARLAEEETR